MTTRRWIATLFTTMSIRTLSLALALTLGTVAHGQEPKKPFEPTSGQAGKDVVWVPSTPGMVNKMLAMAKVTHCRQHLRHRRLGSG